MPSNQPETPTTDALDAAVESSRRLLVYVVENGTTPVALTYTELAGRIAALVAAVEARAVARTERVCEWRISTEEDGSQGWDTGCDSFVAPRSYEKVEKGHPYCQRCGGRVRVEERGA